MNIEVPDYLPELELQVLNTPGEVRKEMQRLGWDGTRLFAAYEEAAKTNATGILSDGAYFPLPDSSQEATMMVVGIGWNDKLVYLRAMLVNRVPLERQAEAELALPKMIGRYLEELLRQLASESVGKFGIGLKFFGKEEH